MGRTLDVLLGRTTKQTARLKSLLGLATKRIAVVRAHREVRCAQARGDVEQLLRQGHPDRALLRAEQVIRERDTLDVLLLLDAYCALLADRSALLDAHRDCPEELREAAAGLCYAAARCGDLPELQEARALLAAKFGRGFASAAAELRAGCGVNAKLVQRLSTALPSLESRQMVLLEIGADKDIPVRLHSDAASYGHEDSAGRSHHGHGHRKKRHDDDDDRRHATPRAEEPEGDKADSKLTFKDVEEAAQAAFESAATAAAAAKAAIELSRAGSGSTDDRHRRNPGRAHADDEMLHGGEDLADAKKFGRIGHVRNYSSDAEDLPEERGEEQDTPRSRPASVRTNRRL
ncbi:hypothetical protein CFC21_060427 [Triticum aestivum]|uniref:DUF292 domain-containing protein n=3 Tax=Triticinae TaxID=1648030 RepID=A0A9R1KFQ5_WHEAT|nr:uncharacterized protein LOC109778831 [Aegilops tauschii subsp. strangulata]XP_044373359.1 uncharacterized protein LOC123095854 [Triticum aestivum]ADP02196.1 DUF292 domain-containing protein [Triticum aestivum]KAF7052310.1 hypothetical protein CFC21_060427 [Triticum aestivum]